MTSPSPQLRCRHHSTVRRVLTVLFPERFTGWSSTIASIAHGNAVASCGRQRYRQPYHRRHLTSPLEIRNVVFRQLYRYICYDGPVRKINDMLGEITIELKLSSATLLSSSDTKKDEDTLITKELLHSLRILLANQRPHHPCSTEEDEPPLDHWTCKDQPLPALTVRDISERYWHRTVYWLCDILSLMCVKFTVIVRLPRTPTQRDVRTLLNVTCDDLHHIRVRTCILRWRLLTLRSRFALTRRCNNCTRMLFAALGGTLQSLRRTGTSDVTKIFIAARFVRWYRKSMADIATAEVCCPHHYRDNYNVTKWPSQFTIDLLTDHMFVYTDGPKIKLSPLPNSSEIIHSLAKFACDIAIRLPWQNNDVLGIVRMHVTDDLLKACHLIPCVMSLLGEQSHLQFSYCQVAR